MCDQFKKPITELRPCTRCGRPLLRERMPIIGWVRVYSSKAPSLQEAMRSLAGGTGLGLPPGIIKSMMPVDVEFEHVVAVRQGQLCFRCLTALGAFLQGISEEESQEYDQFDAAAASGG